MDLLREPWIDVLTVDGPATLSLGEVAANLADIVDVASDDPLVDAAILRLLMAADLVSCGDIAGWLTSTRDRWQLFDPVAPFWQNPQLREHIDERSVSPAVTLFYRYAGNGSVLLDHHHNETGVRLDPAEAARGLVMRQQFSVGGIQPFPESHFGVKSAKAAIAAGRPFVWVDAGNLADTLAVNRRPGPAGEFRFSWPANARVGSEPIRGGQADALTWQSRSMLLVRGADGAVEGVVVTEGLRYGDDTDPVLLPHTLFGRRTPDDPYTAQDVHHAAHADRDLIAGRPVTTLMVRPGWQQLLTAWADPDAPGVLADTGPLPQGARLRLAGLASFQSRLDGPLVGQLPAPRISRADAATLAAGLTRARRALISRVVAAARVAAPSSDSSIPGGWWQHLMPSQSRINTCFEPIVAAAVCATLDVTDAVGQLRDAAAALADTTTSTLAAAHPSAAGGNRLEGSAMADPTPIPVSGAVHERPAQRFVRSLYAALHSRDPALPKLLRWTPGDVDVDVIRITSGIDDPIAAAWTGKLFAQWHLRRVQPRSGAPGAGLGAALRRLGDHGARGPGNPAAVRLLDKLVAAGSDHDITIALTAIARSLRGLDYPPHWETVFTELARWRNPHDRNSIRVGWARRFYMSSPSTAATNPAARTVGTDPAETAVGPDPAARIVGPDPAETAAPTARADHPLPMKASL